MTLLPLPYTHSLSHTNNPKKRRSILSTDPVRGEYDYRNIFILKSCPHLLGFLVKGDIPLHSLLHSIFI